MLQRHYILIAEDDPYLREAYVRRFARTEFAFRTAHNGEGVLKLIDEQAPDLLICDIMMPVADGWSVLDRLPKKRPFPVIMLTNMDDDETRSRCAAYHVDGFLVKKDMTLHKLVEMARSLLRPPEAR